MVPMLVPGSLNSKSCCLNLCKCWIIGMYHPAQLLLNFFRKKLFDTFFKSRDRIFHLAGYSVSNWPSNFELSTKPSPSGMPSESFCSFSLQQIKLPKFPFQSLVAASIGEQHFLSYTDIWWPKRTLRNTTGFPYTCQHMYVLWNPNSGIQIQTSCSQPSESVQTAYDKLLH